jgi:ABC-type multidrug transport system fused ATPase/permease subunit
MMQVMETEPSIVDKPNAVPCPRVTGNVELSGVSFERPGVGRVLSNVSIQLKPNTSTAIVGPSGSGKSTLVALALRLIDPLEGKVFVEGTDLRDIKLDTYLKQIGTVMQDTYLFAGSLAQNLLIAKPDATEEELQAAIDHAELTKWVATLPSGMYEDLDGGSALSAGQKQRIGIARAMLIQPKLLILDEPTSALDAETEREIMDTLKRLAATTTTLMVTHRLDTIRHVDHIVVMESGEIREQGTHAELIQLGGYYANMRKIFTGSEPMPQKVTG